MSQYPIRKVELKRFYIPYRIYFITTVTQNKEPIFSSKQNIEILLEAFSLYRGKYNYKIIAYVILPTHFHWLIIPSEKADISIIMKSVKGYTAKKIGKKIWQHQFLDHCLRTTEDYKNHIDYIHNNPVKHGLVDNPSDYIWSSFRNYYLDDNSVFKIDKIIL